MWQPLKLAVLPSLGPYQLRRWEGRSELAARVLEDVARVA
jgi:hypothetical protein